MAPDKDRLAEARDLAQALHLPLIDDGQLRGFSHALALTPERLELRTLGRNAPGPVSAELSSSDVQRRIQGGRRQPLARACGLHRHGPQRVLDATAGLGRDAAVLAGLGCEVTLFERSPIVAALLCDGLARAAQTTPFGPELIRRIQLQQSDAIGFMRAGTSQHDVVYIDPMYPRRSKAALAKKEMRVLRQVTGDDLDADRLLETALNYAGRRVVVKRPPWAEFVGQRPPDHQLEGNLARYDVYLVGTRSATTASGCCGNG